MSHAEPASRRTTVRRGAPRAVYDRPEIRAILEAGVVAHVGVATDDGPIVLPMAYGVTDDDLLIHGSVANAMMRAGRDLDVCVTVTLVDGLVVARTPFHNSMNYRSVVVRGTARAVTDPDEKLAALRVINDHVAALWDTARPPNETETRQTMVLAVPLAESSAKVRTGDPVDDAEDVAGPYWAGVVPLTHVWGEPTDAADLRSGTLAPPGVRTIAGRRVG